MKFTDLPGIEPCFFKKGEILIADGDRVDHVYYLRKGTVYREIVTDTGIESILSCKEGGGLTDSLIGSFCSMAQKRRTFPAMILWPAPIAIAYGFQWTPSSAIFTNDRSF